MLRFDDVAPNMRHDRFIRVMAILNEFQIKPIIGVIPLNKDPQILSNYPVADYNFWHMIMRLQRENSWSVFQHGTFHLYTTDKAGLLQANNKSEFAGLSYKIQLERLTIGYKKLSEENIRVDGFMAPSHSFDNNTCLALNAIGVRHITDGYSLVPQHKKSGVIFYPQLFSSFKKVFFLKGIYTVCVHLNTMSDASFDRFLSDIKSHRYDFIEFAVASRYASLYSSRISLLLAFKERCIFLFFIMYRRIRLYV